MQEILDAQRAVIVVAHPDDETIGCGALLPYLSKPFVISVTDGSPRNLGDAHRSGYATRETYAAARQAELHCALKIAGVNPCQVNCLGFVDQEAMLHLTQLIDRLVGLFKQLKPEVVLTQPYEGGHPDHDSTAFAVHRAFRGGPIFEMSSYHARDGIFRSGAFLENGGPVSVHPMNESDALRKRRMLACFATQQSVLESFPVVPEQFRRAPEYDFERAPHAGKLHYETLPWGITGERWRRLAACV